MPIYEFRCLKCNNIFEILFTSSEDAREMKCAHCGGEDIERVMSATSFKVSSSSPSAPATASATHKQCGDGSCSTLEIPGKYDR